MHVCVLRLVHNNRNTEQKQRQLNAPNYRLKPRQNNGLVSIHVVRTTLQNQENKRWEKKATLEVRLEHRLLVFWVRSADPIR